MKNFLSRVGIWGGAGLFALVLAFASATGAGAADPPKPGVIYTFNSPTYSNPGAPLYINTTGVNYGNYPYNGGFYYNNSFNGQNIYTVNGCNTGNDSCLQSKGITVPYGYNGYNGSGAFIFGNYSSSTYYPYGGYAGYPFIYTAPATYTAPTYAYNYNYPTYSYNTPYFANYYNGNYYSGVPNSYFTNAGCAVGNYSCLFANNGGNLSNGFFTAVGCPVGNYSCASGDAVFTSRGCTVGNYACVFGKTGVTPEIADEPSADTTQPLVVQGNAVTAPVVTTAAVAPAAAVAPVTVAPAVVVAPAAVVAPASVSAPVVVPQAAVAAPVITATPGDERAADRG